MAGDATAVYAPAYGPVRRAVEYGLFYVVVDRCTRLLVAMLEKTPPVAEHVPALTTASAVALWGMLALILALQVRRQLAANPWDVADLSALRPSPRRLALAGAAVAVGAVTASQGWPVVADLTADPAAATAVGEAVLAHAGSDAGVAAKATGILRTDLGALAGFGAGFVCLTYGLDRVVVGLVREAQYRRYASAV